MKETKTLIVENEMGLHARPAAKVAKLLAKSPSIVYFTCNSKKVDAKQIMNLLLLEAKHASEIEVEIEGSDAKHMLEVLTELFKSKFGE